VYNITFQQIEAFLNIARYNSITKAAENLYISQPTLSKTLHRFEEGIGMKVFDRGNFGITLTPEGEYIFLMLDPIYTSLNRTIDNARFLSDNTAKIIRIVAPAFYDMADNYTEVKKIIASFENHYPDIQIVTDLLDLKELRYSIDCGFADLYISQDHVLGGIKGISYIKISKLKMFVAMSTKHPLAASDTLDYSLLGNDDFYKVKVHDVQSEQAELLAVCKNLGFVPKKIQWIPNFQTLFNRLLENKGISICAKWQFGSSLEKVKFFPLPESEIRNHTVIAWRTGHLSPEVRTFVDRLPYKALTT